MDLNKEVFNRENNTEACKKIIEYLKQQGMGDKSKGMAFEVLSRAVLVYQANFKHWDK
jgi:hypothetical protein